MPAPLSASSKDLPCQRIWQVSVPGSRCLPWHCLIPTASTVPLAFTWRQTNLRSRRTSERKWQHVHHRATETRRKQKQIHHLLKINNQQLIINPLRIPPCLNVSVVNSACLCSFPPARAIRISAV